MKTLYIDHATVVSPDAGHAAATFERLFGLPRVPGAIAAGAPVALAIGEARLEFVTPREGTPLADALRSGGEGMAALTLAVADLDDARRTLGAAGVGFSTRTVDGRSVLDVDPGAAHGVRLTLVRRM